MGLNALVALGSYAFETSAASGVSALALSYAFPNGFDSLVGGTFVLCVVNTSPTDPVHVQMRSLWTDVNQVSRTTTLGVAFSGTSAVTLQTLVVVNSGESIGIPYTNVVGSAVRVVLLNAISGTSSIGASGTVALWAL